MTKLYIGIDIGTSSVKLGLYDSSLNLKDLFQKKYSYCDLKDGKKEIDPSIWFQLVKEGIKKLFKEKNPLDTIVAIGTTGQMHTAVFLDKDGKSVRPAILWNDTRTKETIPALKNTLLRIKQCENAKIVSTGSPLSNLIWVEENEPSNFKKIKHFLMPVDYIVYRLTGKYSTDYCDASTSSMFDFDKNQWSREIVDTFSIDFNILPDIHSSNYVVGDIKDEVVKQLGLPKGIKVIEGTGDNAATALANFDSHTETPLISLGTSGVVVIPDQNNNFKKVGKNIVFSPQENHFQLLTQGTVQAGASLNNWWLTNILHTDKIDQEQNAISEKLLGNNEVLFFPHVNGEKTLFSNPNLRGSFVNLSLETQRENMYLAILEGVAFGLKELFDEITDRNSYRYIRIVGGGANSKLWLKIIANIFGIEIRKSNCSREAIDGAVLLAISGVNEKCLSKDKNDAIVNPSKNLTSKYAQRYEHYLKMISVMTKEQF